MLEPVEKTQSLQALQAEQLDTDGPPPLENVPLENVLYNDDVAALLNGTREERLDIDEFPRLEDILWGRVPSVRPVGAAHRCQATSAMIVAATEASAQRVEQQRRHDAALVRLRTVLHARSAARIAASFAPTKIDNKFL